MTRSIFTLDKRRKMMVQAMCTAITMFNYPMEDFKELTTMSMATADI